MAGDNHTGQTRRQMLHSAMALPTILTLTAYRGLTAASGSPALSAQAPVMPPTPACTEPEDVTPRQTEGPYYKRSSPPRTSLLEPGPTGIPLSLTGFVVSRRCQPLARVLLDFWQADGQGQYDNQGYRYRGHQFTDEAGRYHLETIVPELYPGRTRHIHVKVQAPNRAVLTTQLYFPGEARNARDRLFNPALLMVLQDAAEAKAGAFNFVLEIS